ncbi:MAG: chemotaxis protein CheW [Treponema sp.]|nr:chemotaxis protein CheW [Treponema sp.]
MNDSEKMDADDWPYLIFSSGGSRYAVESSSVKEIVRNNTIYPVPFAPPYLKGIINCYSTPVAAVDWAMFLGNMEEEKRKETIFLVLKDCEDIALLVWGIEEFKYKSDLTKQQFPQTEEHGCFSGTISWDDNMIPLLDLKAALEKIRGDLEKL